MYYGYGDMLMFKQPNYYEGGYSKYMNIVLLGIGDSFNDKHTRCEELTISYVCVICQQNNNLWVSDNSIIQCTLAN